jgi:hypothetical protein
MATEAAWLKKNRTVERSKKKCALTSTGLLMEGLGHAGRSILGVTCNGFFRNSNVNSGEYQTLAVSPNGLSQLNRMSS